MSRWIDADVLKPEYYDEYVVGDDEYVVRYYSETQIDNAPSIDIVRCKECRNYYNQYGDSACMLHTDWSVKADDYCSYGVRKTNTTAEEKPTPIRDYMVHGEREGE